LPPKSKDKVHITFFMYQFALNKLHYNYILTLEKFRCLKELARF